MIKNYKGDLLNSRCDIICHQVNLQGFMGGGLAKQIATKYPECEKKYREFCCSKMWYDLLGQIFIYEKNNQYIINCFSQNEWFGTEYKVLKEVVRKVRNFAAFKNIKTIGIPKNYGCGIANGDWEKVKRIWTNIFKKNKNIELQIWET